MNKYNDALSLAEKFPAIFGPASSIGSHDNLRNAWTQLLRSNATNPLFVTINPHWSKEGGSRAVAAAKPGYEGRDVERTWRFAGGLFRLLDQLHQDCRAPKFLPPAKRFQGLAVMEKAKTNPHVHIILNFRWRFEQILAYWFLLQALDNAPAAEWKEATARDMLAEEIAWREIRTRGGWSSVAEFGPHTSCVTRIAPAATAKVLFVPTKADLERVSRYMTKELSGVTPGSLAARRSGDAQSDYFKELRDFHSPMGIINPATLLKRDPEKPRAIILDLDHMDHWRCKDGTRLY